MRRSPDVMQLLRSGVPVTLMIDLASASGPDSRRILQAERSQQWLWEIEARPHPSRRIARAAG